MENIPERDDRTSWAILEFGNDESESDFDINYHISGAEIVAYTKLEQDQ